MSEDPPEVTMITTITDAFEHPCRGPITAAVGGLVQDGPRTCAVRPHRPI